jgi:hypothetical protein
VVVSEAMRKEGDPRLTAGAIPRVLQAELSSMRRILGMAQCGSKERQGEQRRKTLEGNCHHDLRF